MSHDDAPDSAHGKGEPAGSTGNLLFDVLNATTAGDDCTPPSATLVWIMLANRAKNGKAWPAIATLAKGTRLAQSTVKACLRGLEHNGRIKAVGWFGKGGHASKIFEVYATAGAWADPPPKTTDAAMMADERPRPITGPQTADHRLPDSRPSDLRQPTIGYKPPNEPLRDPPKEPRDGAFAPTRSMVQGDPPQPRPSQAVAFRPSDPPSGESFKLVAPPSEPERKPRRKGDGKHVLPEAWGPNPDAFALGRKLGFDAARVASEADRMRDWARGKGELRVDWHATFANWLRSSSDREVQRGIKREPLGIAAPLVPPPQPKRRPPPPPYVAPVEEKPHNPLFDPPTEEEIADVALWNARKADPEWRRQQDEEAHARAAARRQVNA
jgi:hypothetical protein